MYKNTPLSKNTPKFARSHWAKEVMGSFFMYITQIKHFPNIQVSMISDISSDHPNYINLVICPAVISQIIHLRSDLTWNLRYKAQISDISPHFNLISHISAQFSNFHILPSFQVKMVKSGMIFPFSHFPIFPCENVKIRPYFLIFQFSCW